MAKFTDGDSALIHGEKDSLHVLFKVPTFAALSLNCSAKNVDSLNVDSRRVTDTFSIFVLFICNDQMKPLNR